MSWDILENRWIALHTFPKMERSVGVSLLYKGYEVFLPSFSKSRTRKVESACVEAPLFPRYLFCRFMAHNQNLIMRTPGMHSIVSCRGIPLPVPEGEIDDIRKALRSHKHVWSWLGPIQGDVVEITQGPLQGVRGTIVRKKTKMRLVISVSLMQRSVAVEIDNTDARVSDQSSPRQKVFGHKIPALL